MRDPSNLAPGLGIALMLGLGELKLIYGLQTVIDRDRFRTRYPGTTLRESLQEY